MSDSLANLDLSGLNLDLATLKEIERILNQIELLINDKPETTVTFLYKLKNEIVQLKGQKSKPDTNMIHVGPSELRQSFHAHVQVVQAQSNKSGSSHLLMFYAAECGLKSIWLRRNNLTGTDRIQDQTLLTKDGHNFAIWIKKLRIPPTIGDKIPDFRLARGGSSWDVGKAHQAWRYGVRMNSQDEKAVVEWLENLCSWIKENINL